MPPISGERQDIPAQRSDTSPMATAGRWGVPRVVAVVSDGSALRRGDHDVTPESIAPILDDDAALIHDLTGLLTRAVPVPARDTEHLAAHMRALPADTGAIFLTHTDPARGRAVGQELRQAGAPPVLTDSDTMAITLTAALLTAVTRAGRSPAASRVVIAGAATMPELCPLLMAAGIGDISSWNHTDAHGFPLHHIARHATAVIDLLGATARVAGSTTNHHWPTVISPDAPGYRLLPAPGLLRALASHPESTPDIDVARACALALAAATPPGQLIPEIGDPSLTDTVASAVIRVLTQHTSSGYHGPPHTNN